MSSSQLWAAKPQQVSNSPRPNMVPGTWLQLSPNSSAAVSPNLNAQGVPALDPKEEISLRSANEKFLTNNFVSRSSSMSSEGSGPASRHPPLGSRSNHAAPCSERRELSVGRHGGLGAMFGGN